MISFRSLMANEIDCRISQVKPGKGFSALLYKDARCDMRILDETVHPENWQREHYECKGNLFCRVGIMCGNEWVWKSDCGKESNTEAEKGEASDSFKRACFNWGIGRELYTAPLIWVPASYYKEKEVNGKKVPDVALKVTYMEVSGGSIVALQIVDDKHDVILFERGRCPKDGQDKPPEEKPTVNCFDCSVGIQDSKKRDGSLWLAEDIVSYSTRRFGRPLCPSCQRKAFEAEK